MIQSTDCIKREIHLKAPVSRVWRAISDPREFGEWFGVKLQNQAFVPGEEVSGQLTIKGYENVTFRLLIEAVEPERKLAYRWHPYAIDPNVDYSQEPTTLVVFELRDADGGTHLTVEESGFDQIPAHRRSEAFRMNSGGWDGQVKNIQRHVDAG